MDDREGLDVKNRVLRSLARLTLRLAKKERERKDELEESFVKV